MCIMCIYVYYLCVFTCIMIHVTDAVSILNAKWDFSGYQFLLEYDTPQSGMTRTIPPVPSYPSAFLSLSVFLRSFPGALQTLACALCLLLLIEISTLVADPNVCLFCRASLGVCQPPLAKQANKPPVVRCSRRTAGSA